mmetsp:Transcript_10672/g.20766  ORF Transcript_10672/g.20766 Transcript_10672/m.20766 type:complete len:168 (-) Transcript_10672:592-1095(-)
MMKADQVGLVQEIERLNKKIMPRRSNLPSPEPSDGTKFFRNYERKLFMAEKARPKIGSPLSPSSSRKNFVTSADLLKNLRGLSTGMLTTRGEQFKRTEVEMKRLLIQDGIMKQNGYLNKRYIRRLNQVVSASMPSSPSKKPSTPSTYRSKKGSSPSTFRSKVTQFEL